MDLSVVIPSGLIVMAAICMEGITGFGAAVLAIPFLSMLLDVRTAVPLMSTMSLLLSGIMFLRQRQYINKKVLRMVVIYAGLGFPVGTLVYNLVPESVLKLILGVFVFSSAAVSLVKVRFKQKQDEERPSAWRAAADRVVLFFGGVCHGALGSGGPLIVTYTSRAIQDKSEFRATMVTVWLVFNTLVLLRTVIRGGIINVGYVKLVLGILPFFTVGSLVGNMLHTRVKTSVFRCLMYGLLLFSGASLVAVSLPM